MLRLQQQKSGDNLAALSLSVEDYFCSAKLTEGVWSHSPSLGTAISEGDLVIAFLSGLNRKMTWC